MKNWQSKRIDEINKLCNIKPRVADCFIDEVNDIYESKADSYEIFKQEQEEKQKRLEKEFKAQFRGAAPGTEDMFNVTLAEYKQLLNGEEVNGTKYVKGSIYYITDKNMYFAEKDYTEKDDS